MALASGAQAGIDDETPTRSLDDDALLARFKSWFQQDNDHHRDWVDGDPDIDGNGGAEEDFDFVAGRQWNEEALRVLEEQGRPASVFNRVAPMIDAVSGFEVANRQEVRYIPREEGDVRINELLTAAGGWFRDLSDAEDEESDAFRDCAICGLGWTETGVEYEVNPDGDPVIGRIDPLEIFANREACKPNYEDAKRIWRIRSMHTDDALSLIPEADPDDLHADWATDDKGNRHITRPTDDYDHEDGAKAPAECVIVEVQWWEREPFVRFMDPATGQEQELSQDEFTALIDRLALLGPERMVMLGIAPPQSAVPQHRRVYYRAFLGKTILKKMPTPVEGHFTYKAITGKRDHTKNHFYGLVRAMKDPQRWTNKLFSQIMHILNSNSKGGIFAERGAFEDDRQAANDYAKGDTIVWTNPSALQNGKISPKPSAPFPQGQAQMLEFAMGSMPMVTGINMEFLGMRETNQPGVLEYQRKQSGITILATLFDSLRRYRKDQGRLMLRYIQEFLSDGRLVKISGQENAQYTRLFKEKTLGEYDVIVDDAPSAPNAKERNWAIIQSMFPILGPILMGNGPLTAETLRQSPLPESLINKIAEAIAAPPPPPPPDAAMKAQIGMAAEVTRIDKNASAAEVDRAKAAQIQAETYRDNLDALMAGAINPNLPPAPVPSGPISGLPMMPGMLTPPPTPQMGGLLGPGRMPPMPGQGMPGL